MKRLIALLLLSGFVQAADTYTTNAGIIKPEDGSTGWGPKIRAAYDVIDSSFAILSATQTFTGGQTISSGTVTRLYSSQVIVDSPTYSGSADVYLGGPGGLSVLNGINVGGAGAVGQPYIAFANNLSGGGSAGVFLGNAFAPGLNLRSQTGSFSSSIIDNAPLPLGASRLMVGPSYFTEATPNITTGPSGTESVFENSVFVGTYSVTGAPQFAVKASTSASAYAVIIGTSPTLSTTDFMVGVSTTGALSLMSKTLAELAVLVPSRIFEMYGCSDCTADAIAVSTQTVTPRWARTSSKTTHVQ